MSGNLALSYSIEPSVIIISNNDFSRSRAMAAVVSAGGRVLTHFTLGEALARLDTHIMPDAFLLEVTDDDGAELDRALDQIDRIATRENACLIAAITPDLIDPVSARLHSSGVTLLCNPTPADRVVAIALALNARGAQIHDRSQDFDSMRLQHLADEVGRIAKTLASFTEVKALGGSASVLNDAMLGYKFEAEPQPDEGISAAEIRSIIKLRRMREKHFDAELFADPAWDMMLDLMAARVEHSSVSVSSLCIAAAVPPTTALRWIKTLTEQGLFVRLADPTDGRRVFIQLADTAAASISKYFNVMKKNGSLVV
jgi:DNA-binding MarR family transcriptional regulator